MLAGFFVAPAKDFFRIAACNCDSFSHFETSLFDLAQVVRPASGHTFGSRRVSRRMNKGADMNGRNWILGAAMLAGASLLATSAASAAPLSVAGKALSNAPIASSEASDLIVKTQGRRVGGGRIGGGRVGGGRIGGGRVGGGRFVGGGGRGWRGGGRGISSGAAIGLGVGAAALGILGAAAAAGAAEAPPAYGRCYIVRRPVYDDWGNYLGRRRMRVCD